MKKIKNTILKLNILWLFVILFSCETPVDEKINKCLSPDDCLATEECVFSGAEAEKGKCVTRTQCLVNSECFQRNCNKFDETTNYCGYVKEALNIKSDEVPKGFLDMSYNFQLEFEGTDLNYYFILKDNDSLPVGLTLSKTGLISGTPTEIKTNHQFTVVLYNGKEGSYYYYGFTKVEKTFTITVLADACEVTDCSGKQNTHCVKGECLCNDLFHNENDVCISNTKTVKCLDNPPENAYSIIEDVEVEWVDGNWETTKTCEWNCNENTHKFEERCELNQKLVDCRDSPPENATSVIEKVEIIWSNGEWSDISTCEWNCNSPYIKSGEQCVLCGNNQLDQGEQCDGANFVNTCGFYNFNSGNLICNNDCSVNTSACYNVVSVNWCSTKSPLNFSINTNQTTDFIYGEVIPSDISLNQSIKAQLCYTNDVTLLTNVTCKDAEYDLQNENIFMYKTTLSFNSEGDYYYYYQFSGDNGTNWFRCDINGDNGETIDNGTNYASQPPELFESKVGHLSVIQPIQVGIILNSDFENWTTESPENWHGSKSTTLATKITTSAHSGNNAIQLTNTGTSHKRYSTTTMTVQGGSYTCKYWAKGSGRIRIGYFHGDMLVGSGYTYPAADVYENVDTLEWTEYTYQFNLTNNLNTENLNTVFELILSFKSTTEAKGHLTIDDVVCTKD